MSAAEGGTNGELKKAIIEVLDRSGRSQDPKVEIPVHFYPTEFSVEKSVTYDEQAVPGLTSPVTQFVSGEAESLSMELFFDTYEAGTDVRAAYTEQIDDLLTVRADLHAPPLLKLNWGGLAAFTWVLQSANKRFTMFRPDGTPVRARVDVTFRRYQTPTFQKQETKPESTDRTKVWLVKEGDTLPSIAAREYDDPSKWRVIAAENDITNPRTVEPGRELVLPPLDDTSSRRAS